MYSNYIFIINFNYIFKAIFHKTALHVACLEGNDEIVRLLLTKEDIDVNIKYILSFIFKYNFMKISLIIFNNKYFSEISFITLNNVSTKI